MIARALGIAILAAGVSGCASLSVQSDPPGATVLWSPDGVQPYKQWPPDSWQWPLADRDTATPFGTRGWFGETYFVTVELDGYRRPLPQIVQLYALRNEKLDFELTELPETVAQRMRDRGFLLYRGEWVDPEVANVVEYNGQVIPRELAFRLTQLEKGLVEYDGEWLTPEEAESREAAERLAAGFIRHKDRWVTPEVRESEERIDKLVAEIAASKSYPDLPAPKNVGTVNLPDAQVQIYNSTPQQAKFYFSGPVSREYVLDPFQSYGVRAEERLILPPGRYDIAVVPTGMDASGRDIGEFARTLEERSGVRLEVDPLWSSWPLPAGRILSFNYTGKDQDLQETLDSFEPPDTQLHFTPPVIEIPEIDLPAEERPRRRPGGGPPGGGGGRP